MSLSVAKIIERKSAADTGLEANSAPLPGSPSKVNFKAAAPQSLAFSGRLGRAAAADVHRRQLHGLGGGAFGPSPTPSFVPCILSIAHVQ